MAGPAKKSRGQGAVIGLPTKDARLDGPRDFKSTLNLEAGHEHGFQNVDPGSLVVPAHTDNYRLATGQHSHVKRIINEDLAEGRYVKLGYPPPLISSLGAVPKASGGIRLIHDCSQLAGRSLNDYVRYQTLRLVTSQLRPGYYIAKVDLKSVYQSVSE